MFSLQRLLSRDDKFFDLMESGAEEARSSMQSLVAVLKNSSPANLDPIIASRRNEKRIAQEITEQVCKTFVTPLEREDIEALAHTLYKIPKTAEKFTERFLRCRHRLGGHQFDEHVPLLEEAGEVIVAMVRELRGTTAIQTVRKQNERLQRVEGEGDKLMLSKLNALYNGSSDPMQVILVKDLLEMLEKILDRCRDTGNVVFHIILKYA
jgi:uncharacterized protein Yka (UPF0111/DUF47 family)